VATPQDLLDQLDAEFHFSPFDPCPLNPKPTLNGLGLSWPKTTFVNPPYSDVRPWIEKAVAEQARGKTVVMLVPARTNSKYWHELVFPNSTEIRFLQGNIKFQGHPGPGLPVPLVILVFRGRKRGMQRQRRSRRQRKQRSNGTRVQGKPMGNGNHKGEKKGDISYPYFAVAVQKESSNSS
jgi:site-specific DNA-methyltransferase (adenine-specific)